MSKHSRSRSPFGALVEPRLDDFLAELERAAGAPRFAQRTRRILDQAILSGARRPIASRHVTYAALELSEPFDDLRAATDTVVCGVSLEGERLGALTLPVCDGVVPAAIVADAVAARFGWQILGRFLDATVYRELEVREDGVYRGDVLLDPGAAAVDHDRIGWTVLLQELWNRPGSTGAQLYDPSVADEAAQREAEDTRRRQLAAIPSPSGPSVMVRPGQGKTFDQFQTEDGECRQLAAQRSGGGTHRGGNQDGCHPGGAGGRAMTSIPPSDRGFRSWRGATRGCGRIRASYVLLLTCHIRIWSGCFVRTICAAAAWKRRLSSLRGLLPNHTVRGWNESGALSIPPLPSNC